MEWTDRLPLLYRLLLNARHYPLSPASGYSSLDKVAVPPEPLPALVADSLGRAERLVQLGLSEDTVAADAATQPGREWLLIGEGRGIHRPELRREKLGVTAADPKDDQRAGIADDRGSHRVREL